MVELKDLFKELKMWEDKLKSPILKEYERKLIQCEIAYVQKEIQDRQYYKQKLKENA